MLYVHAYIDIIYNTIDTQFNKKNIKFLHLLKFKRILRLFFPDFKFVI